MRLSKDTSQLVCVLGYGKEGRATVSFLEQHYPHLKIEIADQTAVESKYPVRSGSRYLEGLNRYDLIVKTPGIALSDTLRHELGSKLTSGTQIFLEELEDQKKLGPDGLKYPYLIAVSGSKGKSTTASLIAHVLKSSGFNVCLAGNIGQPMLLDADRLKEEKLIVVLELSSYQLMDSCPKPDLAVLTSIFPEHLDYHGSFANYLKAKTRLTKFQNKDSFFIFNPEIEEVRQIAEKSPAKLILFKPDDSPLKVSETKLIGEHNHSNMAAAWLAVKQLKVNLAEFKQSAAQFEPLPHRLQNLGWFGDLLWIDDAISTAPESTLAALEAIPKQIGCLFLGGKDRGYDFSSLAKAVFTRNIPSLVLFPDSGIRIKTALENEARKLKKLTPKIVLTEKMAEAVLFASKNAPKGTVCLLSTASPSYGIFKGFEDKGDQYGNEVRKLPVSLPPA